MRNPRIALMILLLAAFAVRAVGLDTSPPALNSDELLKAFDGASVYHTGKDHHGEPWPLFFRQSGEYSPPIYIYFAGMLSAPFGIAPYTVRLPSAIFGMLSVLLAYLLARRCQGEWFGLLAAFLVAVSPWNLHFSRIGWEAITLPTLQLAALWLFLRWRDSRQTGDLLLSAFLFGLTPYAYPTARLFTPLIGLGLLLCFFPLLKERWKQASAGVSVFLIAQLPLLYSLATHYEAMQARWNFVSIFNRPDWLSLFFSNYLSHLSPRFLFWNGDANPLHGLTGGIVLITLAPFVLYGLWILLKRRNSFDWFLLFWLLSFAIPASLTYDRFNPASMPNALRTVNGMPLFELIAACGLASILSYLPEKRKNIGLATLIAIIALNFFVILYDAAYQYPNRSSGAYQEGLAEAVEYTEAYKAQYDRIVFSDRVRLHPVSLAVFADKEPGPFSGQDFPKYVVPFYHYTPVYGDFRTNVYQSFGGVQLNSISRWYHLAPGRNLLIALPDEITGASPIYTIRNRQGAPAYLIYETFRQS